MNILFRFQKSSVLLVLLWSGFGAAGAEPARVYQNDFTSVEAGSVPVEFMVLDGQFTVRKEGTNQFLELPGTPLDSFGVIFGPTFNPKTDAGMAVSARVNGSGQGRRYPAMGLGIGGVGGLKFMVTPSKKQLELYQGQTLVANKPFAWSDNSWTDLSLELRKVGTSWAIVAKAGVAGTPGAETTAIEHRLDQDPVSGRCALWGTPYSGKPIRFDDLVVTRP